MVKIISIVADGIHFSARGEYWENGRLVMVTDGWTDEFVEKKIMKMCENLGVETGEIVYEQQPPKQIFSK